MTPSDQDQGWPAGAGLMARAIRGHDWAATPLGPIRGWPRSLRTIVDLMLGSGAMMCLTWGPSAILLYNDPHAAMFARGSADALGLPVGEAWPDLRAALEPNVRLAMAGAEAVARDLRVRLDPPGAPGREIRLDITHTPVRDGDGRVAGVLVWLVETTERVRADRVLRESEARQAFLLELSDTLRPLSDPIAVQEAASRRLGRHLGVDRVAYGEVEADGEHVVLARNHVAPGVPVVTGRFRMSDFGPSLVAALREGRTVCEADVAASARLSATEREAYAGLGIAALAGVPLVKDGRLVGSLNVHHGAPRRWTEEDLTILRETAERTWAALERARAEEALRESEERYRSLFESMDQGYGLGEVIFDDAGRAVDVAFIEANPAATRILGFDVTGRRMSAIADWELSWYDVWGRVARTGQGERREDYTAATGRWFDFYIFKPAARDTDSSRVAVLFEDVTEQRDAEVRLLASEERFRTIVEAAQDYAIFTANARGRIETWPRGAERVFGWTAEEAVGRPVDITFTPGDRAAGVPERERRDALESGQAPDVRWHLRKGGSRVFIEGMVRPLAGPTGSITGYLKVGQDVTARRATEAALRESEERFRQFGDASADVLWIRSADTLAFEYVSPAFRTVYGTSRESILAGNHVRRWARMVVPADRKRVFDNIRRVRRGERVGQTYRILRADGQVRWIRDTSFPLLDEAGRVQRVAGIGHDATEEVELQDRLQILVAELQHRSRNLMGVVRGVTDRTIATSDTLADFRARFRPRLDALARVNSLLSRLEEGDRVTFDQLIQSELQALGVALPDGPGDQVVLRGPRGIPLRSATVQTFALAVHELATNALKYGALSRQDGRLEVGWTLVSGRRPGSAPSGDDLLRVEWTERWDGPAPAGGGEAPAVRRKGYGRELIERALPYQLKARTTYDLSADGVRCTITLPVSSTLDVAFSSQGEADG